MAHNPDEDYELPEFESDFEEEAVEQHEEQAEEEFVEESPHAAPPPPPSYAPPAAPRAPSPPPVAKPVSGESHSNYQENTVDRKIVNLTADIPIQLAAVLGKKQMNVRDLITLRMGQVVELNRLPNEAIDLVANGKLVAKGELVEIEGRLGVRILKIFD